MVTAIIATSLVLIALSCFLVVIVSVYTKRQRDNRIQQEQLKASMQQEILRAQLEIQEQTLKNISQEIHDNIGQTLSLAKLNLNTLPPIKQDGIGEKLLHTKELVTKAIHDLRALSKMLNTDAVLASGLIKALESALNQLERSGVFQTELNIVGSPVKLDSKKELILFRMVQEAIANSIRHSGSTKITVSIKFGDNCVLSICDNGSGFHQDQVQEETGLGLKNMKNRCQIIGATLNLQSHKNHGTQVEITLPIKENEK